MPNFNFLAGKGCFYVFVNGFVNGIFSWTKIAINFKTWDEYSDHGAMKTFSHTISSYV